MSRHANLDDLARLGADDLRPRKAARVGRHLAGCSRCMQLSGQLSGVPALLASVAYPEMPGSLSSRIGIALAAEAAERVAAEPVTEAARSRLPARPAIRRLGTALSTAGQHRAGRAGRGMPAPALRVLATAGAIILVGTGGYEIATHTGGAANSSTAASRAAAPSAQLPNASQLAAGPQVTYRQDGSAETIQTVTSDTNFRAATLADQAASAVTEAAMDGVEASSASGPKSGASAPAVPAPNGNGQLSGSAAGSATSAHAQSQLAGCIGRLVPSGQVVLLVERARYEGARATIIVAVPAWARRTTPPQDAEIWAVGEACSAARSDVLDHVRVARL